MQALAEEWRKRDREREALVKKKVEFTAYTNTHNDHTFHPVLQDLLSRQTHGALKPESNQCKLFYSHSERLCLVTYSQISV